MKKLFFFQTKRPSALIAAVCLLVLALLLFRPYLSDVSRAQTGTEPNIKVAFIGDDGSGSDYQAVLNLIKSEQAAIVVDGGDLDYKNNPSLWDTQSASVLGPTFPYVVEMRIRLSKNTKSA